MSSEEIFFNAYLKEFEQWYFSYGLPGGPHRASKYVHTGVRGRDFSSHAKATEDLKAHTADGLVKKIQLRAIRAGLEAVKNA